MNVTTTERLPIKVWQLNEEDAPDAARRGRVIGFGGEIPHTTDLALALSGSGDYELLSGMAHGRGWAVRGLGMSPTADRNIWTQSMDLPRLVFLIMWSIEWFSKPAWQLAVLMGWDLAELRRALEGAYDATATRARLRFWRH